MDISLLLYSMKNNVLLIYNYLKCIENFVVMNLLKFFL